MGSEQKYIEPPELWIPYVLLLNFWLLFGESVYKFRGKSVVQDTGINRSTLNRLFHETTSRIDFETLEILCKYLECDVSDLLEITD